MRHITVTIYEYMELEGWERDVARRELEKDVDQSILSMTDEQVAEYCAEHEIEFTEEGLVW